MEHMSSIYGRQLRMEVQSHISPGSGFQEITPCLTGMLFLQVLHSVNGLLSTSLIILSVFYSILGTDHANSWCLLHIPLHALSSLITVGHSPFLQVSIFFFFAEKCSLGESKILSFCISDNPIIPLTFQC